MTAPHLGFYNTSGTRTRVGVQFTTVAAAGGLVAPSSAFEAADLRIYRAADSAAFSATQRSSANGITMTSPFDSITGLHDVDIDLTDNTDAGFYASGYRYMVLLLPDETVDGQTVGQVLCYFEIGPQPVNVVQVSGDSVAADNLETAFDDTAGPVPWLGVLDQGTAQSATATTLVLRSATPFASDDACNGATLWAFGSTQGYWQVRQITDYTTADDTATVDAWDVTPSGTITYKIFGSAPGSASVPPAVNVTQVNGNAEAAVRFDRAARAITKGTCGSSSTVTSINTSVLDPAAVVTDQFKGLILAFDKDTATAGLRGQKTDITGSTTGGVLTVTSLTTAPSSGDTFTIS